MDTREQILEAAWKLFAEKGFEDVSVRDVTNEAGVNLASVSYHFGGKEGLIQETVKRCMNPINEYRLRLYKEAVEKSGGAKNVSLRDIANALMRPAVMPEECGVRSSLLMRLAARYLIESDYAIPAVSRKLYTEAFQTFARALIMHFPKMTPVQAVKHIILASGTVVYYHALAKTALQLAGAPLAEGQEIDREEMLKDIVDFVLSGFNSAAE